MTSPQKAKGNGFEREVAKFLSDLYGESFIRAPGSGAYVGGNNQIRKEFLHEGQIRSFKGDIVPGQSFPRMNAECKFYKDFPFHQLFTGSVKLLDQWIEQCLDVADPGDLNILFMKFNRKGTFLAIESRHFPPLQPTPSHFIYNSSSHGSWHILDFDLFWQLNSEATKKLCSN